MHVCMCGRACPLLGFSDLDVCQRTFSRVVVDEMSPFVCNIPGYYYIIILMYLVKYPYLYQ